MICPRCNNEMMETETPSGHVCMHCGAGSRKLVAKPVPPLPTIDKSSCTVGYQPLYEIDEYCPFCNAVHKVYLCKDLCADSSNKSLELFFCHKDDNTRRFTNATSENLEYVMSNLENNYGGG